MKAEEFLDKHISRQEWHESDMEFGYDTVIKLLTEFAEQKVSITDEALRETHQMLEMIVIPSEQVFIKWMRSKLSKEPSKIK